MVSSVEYVLKKGNLESYSNPFRVKQRSRIGSRVVSLLQQTVDLVYNVAKFIISICGR